VLNDELEQCTEVVVARVAIGMLELFVFIVKKKKTSVLIADWS